MTKVKIQGWGWVYIHLVLDWYTKEIIGHHVSFTSKTQDWLEALNRAINTRFPMGIFAKKGKPKLISDNLPTHVRAVYENLFAAQHQADFHYLQQSQRQCRYGAGVSYYERRLCVD